MSGREDWGPWRAAVLCVAFFYALLMVGAPLVDEALFSPQHGATHCAVCASIHSPQAVAEPDVLARFDRAEAGEPWPLRHLSLETLLPADITGRSPPAFAISTFSRRAA